MNLKEYNKKEKTLYDLQLNGIDCPKCGKPLYDAATSAIPRLFPPRMEVECTVCEFKGEKIL